MKYDELFKKSLNEDIFDKDKMFDNILKKIEEDKLKEKLSILLLLLVCKKDSYGFELINNLDALLKQKLKNKEGLIYPILHSLENKDYIKSYWKNDTTTTSKKFYTITKLGKDFIKEKDEVVDYLKHPNEFIYKENFLWN
ncbi:MAG: PadR family transcriptional regulator [Sarcina sp.]